jgi:hypothetical protein
MALVRFSPASKGRLTRRDLTRFPEETLFHRIARAVCEAECLPRKELFEAWEVARRVRRLFRGGRVVDVGGGHGLLAQVMLLLDDFSPTALVIDPALPPSRAAVHDALVRVWPRIAGRVAFVEQPLDALATADSAQADAFDGGAIQATDIVVSSHACGALTDRVLDAATSVRARVAVLPCCHDVDTCETGGLTGWIDTALAIDVSRAMVLRERGYRVWTQRIPADITPKNRLLIGAPLSPVAQKDGARSAARPCVNVEPRSRPLP